jgi:hypothetical protein
VSTTTERGTGHVADVPPPDTRPRPAPRHRRRQPGREPAAKPADDAAPAAAETTESGDDGLSVWSWLGEILTRYWKPPGLWTEPAASLDELSAYAHRGEWTSRHGFARACGIGWWRLVGLPVTAVCRRIEWIAQRPGRFITVFVLVKLLAHTSYGHIALHWLGKATRVLAWLLF